MIALVDFFPGIVGVFSFISLKLMTAFGTVGSPLFYNDIIIT
jgi:hypothetical protein